MNTILFYTSPARGHLYPIMDIAIELQKNGHNVFVQTLESEKENVESEGIRHLRISKEIEDLKLIDYKSGNPVDQIKSTFECWLKRALFEIQDLQETVQTIDPDLIIADVNTWGAASYAESLGKPWAMFMPYCLPVSSPDTPAFGPGFRPPANWLHRLRDKIFQGIINTAIKKYVQQLNTIRESLDVSSLSKYENLFETPDLLLYRTAEPFEYPRKRWPQNLVQTGPGLWAPSGELPEWINDLPGPRILVSVSTEYQQDGLIIENALKALSGEPVSVIVTTSSIDPDSFQNTADNVYIRRFLPHAELIPEVDLVITHGGMGTTQRALANGIPVCVVPWGRDQNETARRVEICGAGVMISKKKLDPQHLLASIKAALTKKDKAGEISQIFKNINGTKLACDRIELLLKENINKKGQVA